MNIFDIFKKKPKEVPIILKTSEEPKEELKVSDSEMYCANCQSYNVHLMQYWKNPTDGPPYIDSQVYICQDCGRKFPISINIPLQ